MPDIDEQLINAAKSFDVQFVEVLINQGADVQAWNSLALRDGAALGNTEFVRLLLAYQADVHAENDQASVWRLKTDIPQP